MKFSTTVLFAVSSLAFATPLPRDVPDGVLAISIEKVKKDNDNTKGLVARDPISESIQNAFFSYIANFTVGTPGQPQRAVIDTGSSDLWVYNSSAQPDGFNTAKSSSYKVVKKDGFSIEYVKGEGSGDWATDNIQLGSASVPNLPIGVVNQAKNLTKTGILGIARASSEAAHRNYPNFPQRLKDDGIISTNAYSLFLDSVNAASGTLLFGGIDTSKYTGELKTVPFTDTRTFAVDFTLSAYDGKLNGVLDSGTSITYLPADALEAVINDNDWGLLPVGEGFSIAFGTPTGKGLTYSFSGIEVHVPVEELFHEIQDGIYLLLLSTTDFSDGIALLGDSTLRSAYVVYDLDNAVAGIAQANYNGGASNIVPIKGSIPDSLSA